ncbi:hypothetical protein GCK32_016563 [Trichostrongylus colubriformis]|uniref:Uncharacterized protein n=1 Tax=Trichostrongylus colubriformis TaxID=6319 RepID=A0AAN8EVQ8_TRICO
MIGILSWDEYASEQSINNNDTCHDCATYPTLLKTVRPFRHILSATMTKSSRRSVGFLSMFETSPLGHVWCTKPTQMSLRGKMKKSSITHPNRARIQSNKVSMAGRRQSMTAQITRQARRLSTVLAPQLTKIEPVNILQKVEGVEIRISDMTQYQQAVSQYILRNSVQFDPIDFDITDHTGYRIMTASLYPDGMMINEGKRKICDLTLASDEDSANLVAKIAHPVTGNHFAI